MKQFFVVKSGLESFDLYRAYGLSLILDKLKNNREKVILKDFGFYYLIESPEINFKNRKQVLGLIPFKVMRREEISTKMPRWDQVLRTCRISGDPGKKTKLKEFKEILNKNLKSLIENYSKIDFPIKNTKIKEQDTLYGTLEPIAFKGIRKIKKGRKYTEGEPYKVEQKDIVLASIGAAYLSVWILGKEGSIAILGKPGTKGILIDSLLQIKKNIVDQVRFHRGGVTSTVIWTSLCLMFEIERFRQEEIFGLFDDLYFNVLKWTGNQPKPEKGGKFSLEFLNKLLEKLDKEDFLDLMGTWINLFKITNRKGLEQLGITLAEFISNPTLLNFERYLKTHLHLNLNKKVSVLYNQKLIKELTRYVST